MTLAEYQLRMEAYNLQRVAKQRDIFMQAFANQLIKATKGKKNPKPVYRKFEQFFDEEDAIDKVRASFEPDYISPRENELSATDIFAKRVAEFQRLKKKGQIIPLSKRKGVN